MENKFTFAEYNKTYWAKYRKEQEEEIKRLNKLYDHAPSATIDMLEATSSKKKNRLREI